MPTAQWNGPADISIIDANQIFLSSVENEEYRNWHAGRWDGGNFAATNVPIAAGTVNGWTEALAGGATSSAEIASGDWLMKVIRENDTGKKFSILRATSGNVLKSTTFDAKFAFKVTAKTSTEGAVEAYIGFFNASNDSSAANVIGMRIFGTGTSNKFGVYVSVNNSAGTNFADFTSPYVNFDLNTTYYFRLRGNGTNITLDAYSTEELMEAGDTGNLDACSLAVSGISGTVTCDRFGVRNLDGTLGNAATFVQFEKLTTDQVSTWYYDGAVNLTNNDFGELRKIDYSSMSADITGTILFDIYKKTSSGGSFTKYDNSGSHYTLAQIQALEDENLWGLGFDGLFDTDGSTPCVLDSLIGIDYSADTTAPSGLTYLRRVTENGTGRISVGFTDAVDPEGNFDYNEMAVDDGGTMKYVRAAVNDVTLSTDYDADLMAKFRNPGQSGTGYIDTYNYGLNKTALGITSPNPVIKMRGVDIYGNTGGWTTAVSMDRATFTKSMLTKTGGGDPSIKFDKNATVVISGSLESDLLLTDVSITVKAYDAVTDELIDTLLDVEDQTFQADTERTLANLNGDENLTFSHSTDLSVRFEIHIISTSGNYDDLFKCEAVIGELGEGGGPTIQTECFRQIAA